MAVKCSACGSLSTQAGLDMVQCTDCGARTNFDGTPGRTGIDDTQRELLEAQLAPREPGVGVVGNFADLQKAGAPDGPTTVSEASAESGPGQAAAAEIKDATKASKTSKK